MSATADFAIRSRALQRYILANEKIIIATHRHWAILWEPILTTGGALVLTATILLNVDPNVRDSMAWLWLPFLVLAARLLYKWLGWRAEWFIMTDRRLLLLTGFIVHRVAMMPSDKVTDLGYERTPMGQVLGYGTFIFETAGQDQSLDRVGWMPRPDPRYRLIIATLFQPDAVDAETNAQAKPDARPPAQPTPSADAAAPPPALMPRIGRRSNPPTQRIEIPGARGNEPVGGVGGSGAVGNPDTTASGWVAAGGTTDPASAEPGGTGTGGPGAGGTAAGGTAAGGGTAIGAGPSGPAQDDLANSSWPSATARAAQDRAERTAAASGRGAATDEHVPGGPTASQDSHTLPAPFIEGGEDPKMR